VSLATDVMHLLVIVIGIGLGAWALVGLRAKLPRGRFLVFGSSSAGALFGCAALAGEVGLLTPPAWFAVTMAGMVAVAVAAVRYRAPASSAA